MTGGYIYLASPYSNYPGGQKAAYWEACDAAAKLIRNGTHCYSPIAHSHGIAAVGFIGTDAKSWRAFNETMMAHSDGMIVVCLDGWETSEGVADEIAFATQANLPISYWNPTRSLPGSSQPPAPRR